jgi:hypothetical protein
VLAFTRRLLMRLFLIWLLGVPIAVTSMVMAQSLVETQHMLKSSALSDALRVEMLGEHAKSITHGKE